MNNDDITITSAAASWDMLKNFNGKNIKLPKNFIKARMYFDFNNAFDGVFMECEFENGITKHLLIKYNKKDNVFSCLDEDVVKFEFNYKQEI